MSAIARLEDRTLQQAQHVNLCAVVDSDCTSWMSRGRKPVTEVYAHFKQRMAYTKAKIRARIKLSGGVVIKLNSSIFLNLECHICSRPTRFLQDPLISGRLHVSFEPSPVHSFASSNHSLAALTLPCQMVVYLPGFLSLSPHVQQHNQQHNHSTT